MKPYTVITKEIINFKGKSKLSDIYIYARLYSTMDYKSGISKYNQDTLSKKFDIPEKTLRDAIYRLEKQDNILNIVQKRYYKENKYILKNYYYMDINPKHYFILNNDFFSLNIDNEIKGFTLLLKSICYNNTNTYIAKKPIKGNLNKMELSTLLNIDRKTLNKYLNKAMDSQLIEVTCDRIVITNDYFPLRVADNIYAETVKIIQDICVKYNAVCR